MARPVKWCVTLLTSHVGIFYHSNHHLKTGLRIWRLLHVHHLSNRPALSKVPNRQPFVLVDVLPLCVPISPPPALSVCKRSTSASSSAPARNTFKKRCLNQRTLKSLETGAQTPVLPSIEGVEHPSPGAPLAYLLQKPVLPRPFSNRQEEAPKERE
jgi:hypothetical protein